MSLPIEISHPEKEGELQVSKSRKLPLLLDTEELAALFDVLEPFGIYDASRPVNEGEWSIEKGAFLSHYATYIEGLKRGEFVDEAPLRSFFSAFFSCSEEALYAMPLKDGRYLLKPRRPIIQLRRHHFIYSEGKFHSGVMGQESVSWGIEFSYPHLYLDPKTKAIGKIDEGVEFPNTPLFKTLTKWVRNHTRPTPFLIEDKKVNESMRLGKGCFEWINNHPGLKRSRLYVASQ